MKNLTARAQGTINKKRGIAERLHHTVGVLTTLIGLIVTFSQASGMQVGEIQNISTIHIPPGTSGKT